MQVFKFIQVMLKALKYEVQIKIIKNEIKIKRI